MIDSVRHNVMILTEGAETLALFHPVLTAEGVQTMIFGEAGAALAAVDSARWDLVLADLSAPGDVAALLRQVKGHNPELPVGLIGHVGDDRQIDEVCLRGSSTFFERPVDGARLAVFLESVLARHHVPVAANVDSDGRGGLIVGQDPAFLGVLELARRAAPAPVPVLIAGESGTGKELVSHLIHQHSSRAGRPFVRVNCAALSDGLLESELFGHERGAFTGAIKQRQGRFERANGGTLLLDEISETSPKLQAELLRVLEQQDFERLGGEETLQVNVRVISTTNRDLTAEARRQDFRSDLYYRISAIKLTIPPLRDRRDDIPLLMRHFVNLYAGETGRAIEAFDRDMMDLFCRHDWPGNVRQLRNVVRAALLLGTGPILSLHDTPFLQAELNQQDASTVSTLHLRDLEREAILEALRRTERNQAKAAGLLGITDRTLRDKLRRYRDSGQLPQALASGESA